VTINTDNALAYSKQDLTYWLQNWEYNPRLAWLPACHDSDSVGLSLTHCIHL